MNKMFKNTDLKEGKLLFESEKFRVACDVCGQIYEDHAGSTPCCGSIAYVLDDKGEKTESVVLYVGKPDPENSTGIKSK